MGLEGLRKAVSSGSVDTRPEILEGYGASGSASGVMPRAVVFPESVEDVASLESWAASSGLGHHAHLQRRPPQKRCSDL